MEIHKCVIGMRNDYENTELITLEELKEHIERERETAAYCNDKNLSFSLRHYELSDYCDKRKNTDVTRFEYCPFCGKKIDWKEIKKEC